MIKKISAEILGTLILTLAVAVSLAGTFPVPTPVIAGLALGMGVYSLGNISGAHFNPAITLSLLAIKKISVNDAVIYICSQLIGAAAAAHIARHMVSVAPAVNPDAYPIMMAELIGTFIFATGVAAAAHDKVSPGASGLVVGGSLLLGISVAASVSIGILNPAVALGLGSFSYSYMLGPIVGAILAMAFYKYISE